MILVNISNQIGAGPRNISLNFIRAAGTSPMADEFLFITSDDPAVRSALEEAGLRHRIVPVADGGFRRAIRFPYVQLLLAWLTLNNRCDRILAFGNFLLTGRAQRKGILMHHPYLVDDALLARLPRVPRLLEQVKRALFRWTLTRVDVTIVQSNYMRDLFRRKYPRYKRKLAVIPNPVSGNFEQFTPQTADARCEAFAGKTRYTLIYASRFYPHKNHAFLLDLARAFVAQGAPFEVAVTLDPAIPGAAALLARIEAEGLPIRNLGEVSQPELARAYTEADAAIFPSRAETFGNPLVEALQFALPVIVPDKGYAQAVLGTTGIFYNEDDVQDCLDHCLALVGTPQGYGEACAAAKAQGRAFPDAQTWFNRMVTALDD